MAQMQQMVLQLVVVLLVITGMIQIYSYSVSQGGYTNLPNFPLANSTEAYVNQTSQFSSTLANATKATTTQSSSLDAVTGLTTIGVAGAQAVTLMFSSLGIMLDFVTQSAISLGYFGVPMWIFGIGITFITILFILGLLGAILKWWF